MNPGGNCAEILPSNGFAEMRPTVPFEVANKLADLSWGDIDFALKRGLIGKSFVVQFAEIIAAREAILSDDNLLDLLWNTGNIEYCCHEMAVRYPRQEDLARQIWCWIVLNWIASEYGDLDQAPRILDDYITLLGYPKCCDEVAAIIVDVAGNQAVYNRRAGASLTGADRLLQNAISSARDNCVNASVDFHSQSVRRR
jgi:hypothetical protein